jgi:hypothetical protein
MLYVGESESISETDEKFHSAFMDVKDFARGKRESEADRIDLVIPAAKEGFLQMCNIGESISIFFASVLEVKAIGKDFCRSSEHVSEVEDSINDKSYENDSPKQVAFPLLDVIFSPEVSNTLEGRKNAPSKNPYQYESSEEFSSMDSDTLRFGIKRLQWSPKRLLDNFRWEVGSSKLFGHYERLEDKDKENIEI